MTSIRAWLKWSGFSLLALLLLGAAWVAYRVRSFDAAALPPRYGQVDARLFQGRGTRQPLLVGLGGSEGGNAWASQHWQSQRDAFLAQGYAFLALGYFGAPGTPARLDRISLDAIHAAIVQAARNPRVDGRCIALIGGSRGGELALALASHYPDIKAVVAIVPGSAVFVGNTIAMRSSSFMYHDRPLPYVPVPSRALPDLLLGRLRPAFEKMLADPVAVDAAAIPVERINGPVYLLSATRDEIWPSTEMSRAMMRRLDRHHFRYLHAHDAIEGGHAAPLAQFERIDAFLREQVLAESAAGCPRD